MRALEAVPRGILAVADPGPPPPSSPRRKMTQDLSHLDRKYFLDGYRYNCPFCNRGSVAYNVTGHAELDWSADRKAHLYLVQCKETRCEKVSLHLSYFYFPSSDYLRDSVTRQGISRKVMSMMTPNLTATFSSISQLRFSPSTRESTELSES